MSLLRTLSLIPLICIPCLQTHAGMPSNNDVIMRTLEFREVEPGSQMDVFQAIADLHVSRLEWTYIDFSERDRACIERVKEMGVLFGGAGSASMHGKMQDFPPQRKSLNLTDLDGEMIVQPHMRAWTEKRGVGDTSNPRYYDYHLAYFKRIIDHGAQMIQRDEPESPVFAAHRYGGGFTPTGVAGFREWLKQHAEPTHLKALGINALSTFDYAVWLRERNAPSGDDFMNYEDPLKAYWIQYWTDTTAAFWERMLADLRAYAGKPDFTISCNNTSLQLWEPYHMPFDYANSELMVETAHPLHIRARSMAAREAGKIQVFGAPKTRIMPISEAEKNLLLRRVFATAYACGMLAKVPWDVYDQSPDGLARYFISPADFADLTAFVRGAGDWSGYQEVSATGHGISESANAHGIAIKGGSGGVYAFLREPKIDNKPMLLHLVDWGLPQKKPGKGSFFTAPSGTQVKMYPREETSQRTAPESFKLLLPAASFSSAGTRFELLVPKAYNANHHKTAGAQSDYPSLVERIELKPRLKGSLLHLDIPALSPWGVLQISK